MTAPPEAADSADLALLRAHAPLLRYDPQDRFRAISAEGMLENPGNVLLDADGEVIAKTPSRAAEDEGDDAPLLTLALLEAHSDRPSAAEERLAQAPGYGRDARRMQAPGHRFAGRIYGRVRRGEDGSAWLQYWFFYYYNPKNLRGLGKHEGDWEMIQVHVDAGGNPDRVSFAQHEFGEGRAWEDVEHRDGRPVVYVGQLSHASYFERGAYPYAVLRRYLPFGLDHALGGTAPGQPPGPEEVPAVEAFPEQGWPTWPGRWGSGERAFLLLGRIGDGPGSPGNQGHKWSDPEAFYRSQRGIGRILLKLVGRLTRFLGRLTFPKPPSLDSAERDGNRLTVAYTVRTSPLRRTTYLLLTVNEGSGAQLVLASRVVRRSGRAGLETFRVSAAAELRVWASAFNGPRQRSELASREVTATDVG